MEHKKFKLLLFVISILIITSVSFYNYLSITHKMSSIKLGIKVLPVIISGFTVMAYFLIYRITIYSAFTLFYLFFCFIGDIFLGLYDPDILDITDDGSMYYYILGGSFFLMSRYVLTVKFMVKPWTEMRLIKHDKIILLISHIVSTLPFIGFGIMFIVLSPDFVSASIMFYLSTGFGPLFSYALLRINGNNINNFTSTESKLSQWIAFTGVFLFNISDVLLLLGMFVKDIPSYMILISNNIYWLSMFLITVSVLRTESESLEKGINIYTVVSSISSESHTNDF